MSVRKEKENVENERPETPETSEDAEAVSEEDAAPEDEEVLEDGEAGASEKSENEDWKDRYIRLQAEFQNYKRRTDKEKTATYGNAIGKFAEDLLEVVDNFERAIEHDAPEGSDGNIRQGMEMILSQLRNVLSKNGVEEIVAEGEEFDPNIHSALTVAPAAGVESGRIIQVVQKGYRIKDKVIRHPKVIVAQ
jgi:molecular chaperone GrpE